jgi:hypothetical protein
VRILTVVAFVVKALVLLAFMIRAHVVGTLVAVVFLVRAYVVVSCMVKKQLMVFVFMLETTYGNGMYGGKPVMLFVFIVEGNL